MGIRVFYLIRNRQNSSLSKSFETGYTISHFTIHNITNIINQTNLIEQYRSQRTSSYQTAIRLALVLTLQFNAMSRDIRRHKWHGTKTIRNYTIHLEFKFRVCCIIRKKVSSKTISNTSFRNRISSSFDTKCYQRWHWLLQVFS